MVRKNVAEILTNHVTFELEAIDRMYLNAYVPSLQTGGGFVYFVKTQLGARVPSTMMVAPDESAVRRGHRALRRDAGDRPGDVREGPTEGRRRAGSTSRRSTGEEGVLFVGKAQEKASVFRTEKRRDAQGKTYPWIIRSTAMVNHYYVYIVDRDFGPLFIKFCSYFPVPREALSEWARVAETPADAAGDSVRAVGQWHPLERRARPRATDRRHARRRQDRRRLSQMAAPTAASRSPPRTARPAIGISSRSCKPSSP